MPGDSSKLNVESRHRGNTPCKSVLRRTEGCAAPWVRGQALIQWHFYKFKNYFQIRFEYLLSIEHKICFKSYCYFISDAKSGGTWSDNRKTCQKKGGDLVSIENEAEWSFLNNEIQKRCIGKPNEWHIGLHKVLTGIGSWWVEASWALKNGRRPLALHLVMEIKWWCQGISQQKRKACLMIFQTIKKGLTFVKCLKVIPSPKRTWYILEL